MMSDCPYNSTKAHEWRFEVCHRVDRFLFGCKMLVYVWLYAHKLLSSMNDTKKEDTFIIDHLLFFITMKFQM